MNQFLTPLVARGRLASLFLPASMGENLTAPTVNPPKMQADFPPAPAVFLCVQSGFGFIPDFELYNLTMDIPGHPIGSSVSRMTLERLGFSVPDRFIPQELCNE